MHWGLAGQRAAKTLVDENDDDENLLLCVLCSLSGDHVAAWSPIGGEQPSFSSSSSPS